MTIDLATQAVQAATKRFETIDCDDERLPLSSELLREPPSDTFCESVWSFQIAPIGVVIWDDLCYFRWGAKRLLAIRRGKQEEKHSGLIDVLWIEGISPDDSLALSMIENNLRTKNELNDYYIICQVLSADRTATINSFKPWGITAGQAKALRKKYDGTPKWALDGALKGDIAPGTLEKIAKVSPTIQQKLEARFIADGELPASAVKEVKQIHQNASYARVQQSSNLFANVPVSKNFLSRKELDECMAQFESERDREIILAKLNS